MTRFEPTLIVTRLVVERNELTAYDEEFREGVNVIRGENSSGKSTILNFIFYALGGDLADWSEHALLCSRVTLEVRLNGHYATLSRNVSKQLGQPMEIFGGRYPSAIVAPRAEWIRYPYKRTPNLESFSQALFRLLKIPEVANEVSGNLTMHQILRLLYSDQLSPLEHLFRYEAKFDSPHLRDAVGRFLCGAFDSRLYENAIKIREYVREFDAASGELKSLFAVLGKTQHSLTLDWVTAEYRSLQEQQKTLQDKIEVAERELFRSESTDQLSLDGQTKLYEEVRAIQSELVNLRDERDSLVLSIADSAQFIRSLEVKLTALNDASVVAGHFGDAHFSVCPACYSPVAQDGQTARSACPLCKTPFETAGARDRLAAMINEAAIQLKQSRSLQERREETLRGLHFGLQGMEERWRQASRELSQLQRLPSSAAQETLRQLQRQSGYLERQFEDLTNKSELIQLVDEVSKRKDALNESINRLKTDNERLEAAQEDRLSKAKSLIADQVRILLRNDLRRQDSFEYAESIEFDFAMNQITVDGHSYFSASSRVILKSSFFLGFFAAATKDPQFRHPRFVMIDTTEDKGMEVERSHNFQNQILRISEEAKEAKVEHQIIYATAMISPDLEEYAVGDYSRRDVPTLDIQ